MALTHTTAIRNTLADAVVDAIDGATSAGRMEVTTSATATILATITFADPAFGSASSGTASVATGMTAEASASAGTAANFIIRTATGLEIFRGTVATSGADLDISSTTIGAGDTVTITSLTYSAPA